ncbi:MAG: DUF4116 domain-containing protein, partial [Treponema sp.]|nr:DUF4116 domain-containing protein [Treponema sp.]
MSKETNQNLYDDVFLGEDKNEDSHAWVSVFFKDGTKEIAEKFISVFKEKWTDIGVRDAEDFDEIGEVPVIVPSKVVITCPGGHCSTVKESIDETAKEFPSLTFFALFIYSDVQDDGYAGSYYQEYVNGNQTEVKHDDIISLDEDQTDEELIEARNKTLQNDTIPVLEAWLKKNSSLSKGTKPKKEKDITDSADYKKWLKRVSKDGNQLDNVPAEMKTAEMCQAAFDNNYEALSDMPNEMKTEAMIREAFEKCPEHEWGSIFSWVPERLRSKDICLKAIKGASYCIKRIPDALKTAEFYLEAVSTAGRALQDIPEEFKTEELCLAACQNSADAFSGVPKNYVTPEFYFTIVKGLGKNLTRVPDDIITMEMCLAAVQQAGGVLKNVPESFKTEAVCLAAV